MTEPEPESIRYTVGVVAMTPDGDTYVSEQRARIVELQARPDRLTQEVARWLLDRLARADWHLEELRDRIDNAGSSMLTSYVSGALAYTRWSRGTPRVLAPGKMSDMGNKGNTGFTLPRGATGFFVPKDGPLPETDLRAFRAALYAAARTVEGQVGEIEGQEYPRTFHTASVVNRTGESVILCHAHHPWIAFVQERRNWYAEEFLPPPPWASTFAEAGFMVLSTEQLATPLSDVDTSVLAQSEWRQIRSYGITTLGGTLFNAWA